MTGWIITVIIVDQDPNSTNLGDPLFIDHVAQEQGDNALGYGSIRLFVCLCAISHLNSLTHDRDYSQVEAKGLSDLILVCRCRLGRSAFNFADAVNQFSI